MIRRLTAVAAAVTALALTGCAKTESEMIASATAALAKNDRATALIELKNAIEKNPSSAQARYLLGKTLLEAGDVVTAEIELSKALDIDADQDAAMVELARALLANGQQAKVVARFGQLTLQDRQANADLQTTVAASYAALSDTDRAFKAVDRALTSKPDFAPALVARARLVAQDGKPDLALEQLAALLAKEPGHEAAGLLKGELLLNANNDATGALGVYRQIVAAHPDSVVAQSAVVALLLRQGNAQEARQQFEQLKRSAPRHSDTLFFEAQFAFRDGNFRRARELADQLLKDRPDSVRVLEVAAAAEIGMQQYVQAEYFLTKVVKAAPGLVRARQALAQTYLRLNQPKNALDVLQPLLGAQSVDATSLSLAGTAWLQQGDDKRADAAFKAAMKVAPNDASVRAASALARAARGSAEAIDELESVVAADKTPRLDLALISALLSQKNLAGALKAIERLQAKMPEQPLAYGMRGRVLLLKGDVPGASKAFEQALSKDPAYYPAISSLSAIDLKNGKPDLARQRLEAATKARPKDYQGFLALAELSARTGASEDEVLQQVRAAVKAAPGHPAPNLALIAQLIAAGRGKESMEAAQVAAGALPNDANIIEALGRAQMSAGDGNQASVTFKKLTAQQPSNAQAQLLLADAYVLAKDNENAKRALRQALTLRPDWADAERRLVAVAIMSNRPAEGLELARDLQKRQPKAPLGYSLEGEVESSQKHWDAAVAAYRQALQREPSTGSAVNVFDALRRAGHKEDAEKVAAEWLKGKPKDVVYLFHLANASLVDQNAPLAESRFRAVLELQPNNALALNNLAWILLKQGKPGAVSAAEKADKLLPGRAVVLDTLAAALAADNQLPRALTVQQQALDRSPNDATVRLNLARLLLKAGEKSKARTHLEALTRLGEQFPAQPEVAQLLKSL